MELESSLQGTTKVLPKQLLHCMAMIVEKSPSKKLIPNRSRCPLSKCCNGKTEFIAKVREGGCNVHCTSAALVFDVWLMAA